MHLDFLDVLVGREQSLVGALLQFLLLAQLLGTTLRCEFVGRLAALDLADGHAMVIEHLFVVVGEFRRDTVAVIGVAILVDYLVVTAVVLLGGQGRDRECK